MIRFPRWLVSGAGGGCPLRGATRPTIGFFLFLALMIFVRASDAQTPVGDCPIASYDGDISLLNSVWLERCGHCLVSSVATATPSQTPRFQVPATATLTPTLTYTPSQTYTPTQTQTPNPLATMPPQFENLGGGFYRYDFVIPLWAGGNTSAVWSVPEITGFPDLALVGFGYSSPISCIFERHPNGCEDELTYRLYMDGAPNGSIPALFNREVMEILAPACLDVEVYSGSYDNMCDSLVIGDDGVAYHDHIKRWLSSQNEFHIGTYLYAYEGSNEFIQPNVAVVGENWYQIEAYFIYDSLPLGDAALPTLTPTVSVPEPVCELIEWVDVPTISDISNMRWKDESQPYHPSNVGGLNTFNYPFVGPGSMILPWGQAYNSLWLATVNNVSSIYDPTFEQSNYGPTGGEPDHRVAYGGGVIRLGNIVNVTDMAYGITWSPPAANGSNFPTGEAEIWYYDQMGIWVDQGGGALPKTNGIGTLAIGHEYETSYIYIAIYINGYGSVQPFFEVTPIIQIDGVTYNVGDELCVDAPIFEPTFTPTLDPAAPTLTATNTRTPVATFTGLPSQTPTQNAGYCSQYIWRTTPTPTLTLTASGTPSPSATNNVTQTQAALDATATSVNQATATANAGTVWAGGTNTSIPITQTAIASTLGTVVPTISNVGATATALAATATMLYPITATFLAGDYDLQNQATFEAYATSLAVDYSYGTPSPDGSGPNYVVNPDTGFANKDFNFDMGISFTSRQCYRVIPRLSNDWLPMEVPGVVVCVRWMAMPHIVIFRYEIPFGELLALMMVMAIWRFVRW